MYEKREEEHGWMEELYAYWGVDNAGTREFVARRYIERVIGCIENVANPACTLSVKEKVQEIGRIIGDEKVRKLLKVMQPRSTYMKVMLIPVRMNSAFLTYLEGVLISAVRRGNVKTFAKLKAER
jgi:glycosyltransferase EpsJ